MQPPWPGNVEQILLTQRESLDATWIEGHVEQLFGRHDPRVSGNGSVESRCRRDAHSVAKVAAPELPFSAIQPSLCQRC
jgi:hypothetical protein